MGWISRRRVLVERVRRVVRFSFARRGSSTLTRIDPRDCRPLVDAYWASLPPERQKERTTTRLSHKRKKKEEEKPDEPEEPVASTSTAPAPAPPSPGTVALIPAPSSAPDPDSQAESTQHSALRYRDQAKSAYGDGRGDRSPTRGASTVEPKDEPDDGMPLFSGNSSQSGIEDLLRQVALGEPVEEDEEDWRQSGQSDEGSQEDYSLIADWEVSISISLRMDITNTREEEKKLLANLLPLAVSPSSSISKTPRRTKTGSVSSSSSGSSALHLNL